MNQEFFPKIQSNEKINFITLNFTSLGTNIVTISSTEYLSGLTEIIPIESEVSILNQIPTNETPSDNYLIWLLVGGILVPIIVFLIFKILKNKN